ncbi:MAG TPA: hexose kinase [Chloroflexota bacterium]|nr:hexose kinase [Chloroflexota bacterium]
MILTVTLNAALDRTLVAPGFALGQSRTVDSALTLGGGKGLNVTRALLGLDHEVVALGLVGGVTGEAIRVALDLEGVNHQLTEISGNSRTCTAIVDPETGIASEINEPGPTIQERELDAFLKTFRRQVGDARLVALSGSLPAGVPFSFYAHLIGIARQVGVPCALDTSGPALREGLAAAPALAKPNQHEAADLWGRVFDPEDAGSLAALPTHGPTLLAITLGAAGALLHGPVGSWRAVPPTVRPIDTVGAGDSFVAGLCAALLDAAGADSLEAAARHSDVLEHALRLATALATASTLTVGAGICDPEDTARIAAHVRIRKLTR